MSTTPELRVAVLGATGLVGQEMIRLLEERRFPLTRLRPLASKRSAGGTIQFRGETIEIEEATPQVLAEVDLVLSSAGGSVSRELLPGAAKAGAVCIDNTSAFRMDPDTPLVVPEVNGHRLDAVKIGQGGIVANPNCSTIQLVAALKPILDAAGIRRTVVSTYQSISGAGRGAVDSFRQASSKLLEDQSELPDTLKDAVAFDAKPQIGDFGDDGHTTEETKMIHETPKILEAEVPMDVTCVRVPVFVGHAETVLVETERPLGAKEAAALLAKTEGIVVHETEDFPTQRATAGDGDVHIGRIRAARTCENGLQMWVVADNLLKGAALNAVQIAEQVVARSFDDSTREALAGAANA